MQAEVVQRGQKPGALCLWKLLQLVVALLVVLLVVLLHVAAALLRLPLLLLLLVLLRALVHQVGYLTHIASRTDARCFSCVVVASTPNVQSRAAVLHPHLRHAPHLQLALQALRH